MLYIIKASYNYKSSDINYLFVFGNYQKSVYSNSYLQSCKFLISLILIYLNIFINLFNYRCNEYLMNKKYTNLI